MAAMSNVYMVRPTRGDWEAGLSVEATFAGSGEEVGSVKVRPMDRSTALISGLYVKPAHRRRGVSRKLMQAVLQAARVAGVHVLRLRARPESPQIGLEALLAFYRNLGFRQTGSSIGGHPVMELRLTDVRQSVGSRDAALKLRRVVQRMDDGQAWKRERDERARKAQEQAKEISNKQPRRTVGTHTITIGIPYRDDGMGKAVVADTEAVAKGTNCRVVVVPPDTPLRTMHLDAIFLPGGPYDQPNTKPAKEGSRDRLPRPEQPPSLNLERISRHEREIELIREATEANIPVLGICGGSRRLATAHGATQVHLEPDQTKTHTRNMTDVRTQYAHDVAIPPGTLLNRMVATGNYRRWKNSDLPQQPLTIPVNSVHWASSHFPPNTHMKMSAYGLGPNGQRDGVLEGFEHPTQHFQVGVQWHPEYAQHGEGDFAPYKAESGAIIHPALPHKHIMNGLGDAAEDGYAARVLQSGIRGYLGRRMYQGLLNAQKTSPTQGGTPPPSSAPPSGGPPLQGPPTGGSPRPGPTGPLSTPDLSSQRGFRSVASSGIEGNPWFASGGSGIPHSSKLPGSVLQGPVPSQTLSTPVPHHSQSSRSSTTPPQVRLQPLRRTGKIKMFDNSGKFGFIQTNGGDYHFRYSAISSGRLVVGVSVSFVPNSGRKGNFATDLQIG